MKQIFIPLPNYIQTFISVHVTLFNGGTQVSKAEFKKDFMCVGLLGCLYSLN